MGLDVSGFKEDVVGGQVVIEVDNNHKLLRLARSIPWQEVLDIISTDIKKTSKGQWWRGRPLRLRVHLGVYILQQLYDFTDEQLEEQLKSNAVYQLFCGKGVVDKWHCPDSTKISDFRNRILPDTHRVIANIITKHAVKLGFGNPKELDIDSTIQQANVKYPNIAGLLKSIAVVAWRLAKALNKCKLRKTFKVELSLINRLILAGYTLKRKKNASLEQYDAAQRRLWEVVYENIVPIYNNLHHLRKLIENPKHWNLRRDVETLSWRGMMAMDEIHAFLFEGAKMPEILSLHAYDVRFFNKRKLNKKIQYGRQYQLGRIGGNFLYVGCCTSLHMADSTSFKPMIWQHKKLFGSNVLKSVSTDKGYYSYSNEQYAKECNVAHIYLPRRNDRVYKNSYKLTPEKQKELYNRRAGIEPLIGHVKNGGQMRRSRMKSDVTTKAAGYRAVLGFNLRQLMRNLNGEVAEMAA